MAVKRYNPSTGNWEIFPGTAGEDAYEMARTNGYIGTKEEYIAALIYLPQVPSEINTLKQSLKTNYFTKSEINDLLSNQEYPTLVEVSASQITNITPGIIISGWNSSSAIIADYTENSLNYSYIFSSTAINTWTSIGSKTIAYKAGWNNTATKGAYLYRIEWLGSYISIGLETYETKAVSAESIELTFSISNLNGSEAEGELTNTNSGESIIVEKGMAILKAKAADTVTMHNNSSELAGSKVLTSSDITSQAVVWQLDNDLCTPSVSTSSPVTSDPVSSEPSVPSINYSILADIVYADDKPYGNKEVTLNYNGLVGEKINTNEAGKLNVVINSESAPVSLEVIAEANTLYNGSPNFSTDNIADLGTLVVPISSGTYLLTGTIYYSDNIPYEGTVTWADGEGMSGVVNVVNGIFTSEALPKATGRTINLILPVLGNSVYIDTIPVSYEGYMGTFDVITLESASSTAVVTYKITGQINYKDNIGYSGEATLSSSVMSVLDSVEDGQFEWIGGQDSGLEDTMYLHCAEESFTITNSWETNMYYDFGTLTLSTYSTSPTLTATVYNEDGSPVNSSLILQYTLSGYANPINKEININNGVFNYVVPEEHYKLGICNLYLFHNDEQIVDAQLNGGNCIFWSDSAQISLGDITLNTTLNADAETTGAPEAGTTPNPQ